jgi:hypothetical protein
MKIDINKSNELLNKSGIARSVAEQTDTDNLFNELTNASYRNDYAADADLDEEIADIVDDVVFEMKDLDFCLINDSEFAYNDDGYEEDETDFITLYVSFRADKEWDQHMEIEGVTTESAVDDWDIDSEQVYSYRGSKDIATLRKEFEALGATYSTELEESVT